MRTPPRTIAICLAALLLVACKSQQDSIITRDTVVAFGGFVEVRLVNVPESSRKAVLKQINDELSYMQFAFNSWKAGPIGRTNELLALAGKFTANPSVIPLLKKAQKLARESHDLFNPAIGKLVALWGFQGDMPPQGPPPDAAAINRLVNQHPRMRDFSIQGVRVNNTNPDVKLDLGGIAKGYAIDVVIKTLRAEGVRNALIEAGGDIRVSGRHGNKPWHIGIRDPRGKGIIASLDARNGEAVFTSGDYERFYDYQGKRYNHILDPRTGYPAEQTRSVTVIADEGARADAAATALFVAGPHKWAQIASDMRIDKVMLIDKTGRIYMTPKMHARIKLEKPANQVDVVSLP